MPGRIEPKDESLASAETVTALQAANDLKLKATQIRQLYEVARPGVFIAAAATVLVLTGVLWTVTQRRLLIAWCVAGLIMYLVRQRFVAAFDRSSPDDETMLWWGKVCVIASWIGGIHWGVATLFLFPADSLLHQTVVAFIVSGICVGTIAAASARKDTYLPVITIVLLSQACRYFWEGDYAHVAMGFTSIVLLAIFIMIANSMNKMNTESLKLRFHNEDLIHEVMEREAQYRSLVDHAPIGILFANNEGRITEWNPRLLDILGLSSEEAAKFLNLYAFPPLTKSGISAAFRRCIEENQHTELEVAYESEQGNTSNLSIALTPRRDSARRITGAQALVEDITDRKREELERRLQLEARAAEELRTKNLELSREIETRKVIEESLRVSEERFRAIFENTEDSMFIKNEELEYTHVNPAFLKLLDRDNSGVIGKTDEELSLDSDYSAHAGKLEIRVLNGETVETEHTLNWKGWPITLNVVRFPLRGSEGKTFGTCAIARDVSDRRNRDSGVTAMMAGDYPSVAIQSTIQQVNLAAESDSTVLFLGESGAGKDHWARVLHERSHRSGGSFLTINCAALNPELVQSELFGHEAGAFTGAQARRRGLLELAEGGCLLLNEIGEMPLSIQSKLLTFLDTQTIMRLGGQVSIPVDVRILAATNRDIQADSRIGRFRSDLFYRLDVFNITVPPLRERSEDIPVLVWELLSNLADRLGLSEAPVIDSRAMDSLIAYNWPGNVRELGNVLERALILSGGHPIGPAHVALREPALDGALDASPLMESLFPKGVSFQDGIDEAKRMLICRALQQSGGRIKDAAALLGMTRNSINHHMRYLGISRRPTDPS